MERIWDTYSWKMTVSFCLGFTTTNFAVSSYLWVSLCLQPEINSTAKHIRKHDFLMNGFCLNWDGMGNVFRLRLPISAGQINNAPDTGVHYRMQWERSAINSGQKALPRAVKDKQRALGHIQGCPGCLGKSNSFFPAMAHC